MGYQSEEDEIKAFTYLKNDLDDYTIIDHLAKINGEGGVIKFGKHKGKTFKKIREEEPSYLLWILRNFKVINKELKNYIEENLEEIKKEAEIEHAKFLEEYCDGEVVVPH